MITFLIALLMGFVAGFLVFRKNRDIADSLEDRGRKILNALKRGK